MILLIDNYDSFVFNVEQYLKELTNEEVKTVRNDEITLEGIRELNPDRIVLSPGPKHPKDSGICLEILKNIDNIPILGICLGHQAFGLVFGGKIERLETPLHGKTSEITVTDKNSILFKDMPEKFNVMRYHSLYVSEENLPEDLAVTAKSNDGIIMALEHRTKSIYGVQFHPESFFTEYGKNIIRNFIVNTKKISLQDYNEKIEELEKLDLKLEDMEDRENFDFGDMKTFFCEEEDIRNIFQNEELENNINFLSKNNQLELGDLKNIKLKDVLVVVVLIGIYVFLNGMIPLGKQVEKNNNLKKQVKSLESEYLKEKNEKLPDYSEELSKLNEIDNGIKRKEYYSFIKFLVDNSIKGIDYTKVKYENKKWLIQGEIENFDNFEKFESSVRKKYENSELGYIKDNDETTVFEYTVSEKE